MSETLLVKRLREGAVIPSYQTEGAAGFDLHSAEGIIIEGGETAIIKTGLAFDIPKGFEMQIRPRSGISFKTPLIMKNGPGTIDSDYRGEVGIIMHNLSSEPFEVKAGERMAQGIVSPVVMVAFCEVEELSESARGTNGYGSTGIR